MVRSRGALAPDACEGECSREVTARGGLAAFPGNQRVVHGRVWHVVDATANAEDGVLVMIGCAVLGEELPPVTAGAIPAPTVFSDAEEQRITRADGSAPVAVKRHSRLVCGVIARVFLEKDWIL